VVDDVLLPRGRLAGLADVLVPDDQRGAAGGAEQVGPAVAVEVRGANGARLGELVFNDLLGPFFREAVLAGVAEPDELVAALPAGGGHVEPAVAVEVAQRHVVGPGQLPVADNVSLPR